MCKEYNGRTNYETWLVKLWLDNNQGDYNYMVEIAKEMETISRLADNIENYLYDYMPKLDNDVYSDLLNGAIHAVNWYEIAKAYKEEVQE